MYAVATLLNEPVTRQVEQLWGELRRACGLTGIQAMPIPHFSWQGALEYDRPALETVLQEIAAGAAPLRTQTSGLGVFTGPAPVIYLPLVRTAGLSRLHQRLWDGLAPFSRASSPYYAPPAWMPHITLAYGDVLPENIGCAIQGLAFRAYELDIEVDNLALISANDREVTGLSERYRLSGPPEAPA
jgi:2'-5' RNA ligase